ncbi:MAG: hypothetical protein ACO2ZM_06740 [Francisellaceae bacterium]
MEKLNYEEAKALIKPVNQELYEILEDITPDDDMHIYLAEYPYGVEIADKNNYYFPFGDKLIAYEELPQNIKKDFAGWDSNIPFGIVLEKSMEHYLYDEDITTPGRIYHTGDCFGYDYCLKNPLINTLSIPVYQVSAGARSCFCITNLGNGMLFAPLKKKLKVNMPPPKKLYDHKDFFQALYQSFDMVQNWKLKLLYFSPKWKQNISDKKHKILLNYLYDCYWMRTEKLRILPLYEHITSDAFKQLSKYKPEPYIVNVIRNFLSLFINAIAGYSVQSNDNYLPLKSIQNILTNEYNIPHSPIIMAPEYFDRTSTLYYSLSYPSTIILSNIYSTQQSTLKRLDELHRLTMHFFNTFHRKMHSSQEIKSFSKKIIFGKTSEDILMKCFHTHTDQFNQVSPISELEIFDKEIAQRPDKLDLPSNGPFLRGLIGFKKNEAVIA